MPNSHSYKPGDLIVFRKQKTSTHPGPRATDVHPARFGDEYRYTVEKFWIVDEVAPDGQLIARTRTGKRHTLDPTDPRLRPAGLWHRLLHHRRFADLQA